MFSSEFRFDSIRRAFSWCARRASILALVLGLIALGCAGKTEEERLQEAQKMAREHNLLGAIIAYQEFLKKFPESPLRVNAQAGLAQCYMMEKDYPKAREALDAVIQKAGGASSEVGFRAVMMKLGTYTQERKMDEALKEALSTSASLKMATPAVQQAFQYQIANLLGASKRFDEALEIYGNITSRKAVTKDDQVAHVESLKRMVDIYITQKNAPQAILTYQNYLEKNSGGDIELELRRNLGKLLKDQGRTDESRTQLDAAEAIARKRFEEAKKDEDKAVMMMSISDINDLRGDGATAKKMLRQVIDDYPMGPLRPTAMRLLADQLARDGDLESAMGMLAQIADVYPNTRQAADAMQRLQILRQAKSGDAKTSATQTTGTPAPAAK